MNENSYPHAIYKLLVDGTDIGTTVQDRFIRMTITDNRGIECDSIDLELSDHDGLLEIPPKGQKSKHGLDGVTLVLSTKVNMSSRSAGTQGHQMYCPCVVNLPI